MCVACLLFGGYRVVCCSLYVVFVVWRCLLRVGCLLVVWLLVVGRRVLVLVLLVLGCVLLHVVGVGVGCLLLFVCVARYVLFVLNCRMCVVYVWFMVDCFPCC